MRHTTFLAYYTSGTPYKEIAEQKLIPSLKKFKLNYTISEVPNLGNWYKNTAFKAKFVLDYLVDYPFEYNLVLLDVDAIIEKEPKLFDEISQEYDLAFHTLSWNKWYGYKDSPDVKELLTGTMMFRNRLQVKEMCKEWYRKATESQEWEQKVLQKIIGNYDLKIYDLPIEYIYIDTLPNGKKPITPDDNVIIRHFQASREWKRKIPILDILKRRKNK